jgi:hypothetical protein
MSKELPYFKFFSGEWLNGDITLEDYELQGLFINVCAYYWHKDGDTNFDQLIKKFRTNNIVNLIPDFLECDEENGGIISIAFLDEQLGEFKIRKKKLSNAGKKGARRKAELKEQATLTPPLSDPLAIREDKEEEKEKKKIKKIEDRRKDFATSLKDYSDKFSTDMINEFFLYWSEHGENDKKMRFEKQTSFSIQRRLGTWKTNEEKFKQNGTQKDTKSNRATTTKSSRQSFE